MAGHVVAMGGFGEALVRFALSLAGKERPRVLYLPTAVADAPWWIADFWSAGGNFWFEGSVTDSFSAELDPLQNGLALLPGSFCPHYDGEVRRRPVYEGLVTDGVLAPGFACDDALHFSGTELVDAVASRPDARAWRVTSTGSAPLELRALVVWLDLPIRVWLPRLAARSYRRWRTQEELWNGNREELRNLFWGRESLFVWAFRSHVRRRREYQRRLAAFNVMRLRTPAEVDRFIRSVSSSIGR